jgi:hypothetical protein
MSGIRERHQTYWNDGREWCRAEGVIAPCDTARALAAGDALAEAAELASSALGGFRVDGRSHAEWVAEEVWPALRAALARWREVVG